MRPHYNNICHYFFNYYTANVPLDPSIHWEGHMRDMTGMNKETKTITSHKSDARLYLGTIAFLLYEDITRF